MTVLQLSNSINRFDAFLNATRPQMLEFQIWKLETDLTHINLNGNRYRVETLNYIDWIQWRLEADLNAKNTEGVHIEVETPEFQILN